MATFYMYVGAPASGKTTIAHKYESEHAIIIDSDEVRARICPGGIEDQSMNAIVFNHMFAETCGCLERDINVAYVATNISSRRRINLLSSLKKKFPKLRCVCRIINTPIQALYERNAARERHVPDYVITRMLRNFEMPYVGEGWTTIEVIDNYTILNEWVGLRREITKKIKDFGSQKNSHHKLSLYEHCALAEQLATKDKQPLYIIDACFLHDFGKAYTQTYWEKDNFAEAHYPNHQNLSGYLCLNMGYPLHIAQLCAYHMIFYADKNSQQVWRKRLGEKLWNDIKQLHHYDEIAH